LQIITGGIVYLLINIVTKNKNLSYLLINFKNISKRK